MSGFFGWFLIIVGVIAVFNAEKLPALRKVLEEKFKDSVEAAKEGSKIAKSKLEQAKKDIEAKKNASPVEKDPEENTPEEIEESLQFMGDYINKAPIPEENKSVVEEKTENINNEDKDKEKDNNEEKPISLDPM